MKKISKKIIANTILMCLICISMQAQSEYNEILKGYFQTPNAASLGIFGQIPVSLYTGMPQIDVPIYSIKEDAVSVNIGLSYHTHLIKPNTHPSWVGLGWNLRAGGAITRIPNGRRDEGEGEFGNINTQNIYNSLYHYLDATNWETGDKPTSVGPQWDYEPDEFMFNFGNYSGSFFKNHKGVWQVKTADGATMIVKDILPNVNSESCIQVGKSGNGLQVCTQGYYSQFTIITEDGTQYIFGGNNNAMESNFDNSKDPYSESYIPSTIYGYTDTWMLTKIVTAGGREINFEYERKKAIQTWEHVKRSASYYLNISNKVCDFPRALFSYVLGLGSECVWGTWMTSSAINRNVAHIQTPVYLKSISSDHFQIEFFSSASSQLDYPTIDAGYLKLRNVDTGWVKLDSIQVKNSNNDILKRFSFDYVDSSNERLKLLSFTEKGTDNSNPAVYTFQYNTKKMPAYSTQETDHWGYYNGVNPVNSSYANFAERKSVVDFDCLKSEILEEITYPTQGKTIFEYEAHACSQYVDKPSFELSSFDQIKAIGGLRIKKIKHYDNIHSNPQEIEYLYVRNYSNNGVSQSSGILAGIPQYMDGVQASNSTTTIFLTFEENKPGTLSYTNGSPVTYSEVVEKETGKGYTIHKFTNFDTDALYRDKQGRYSTWAMALRNYPFNSMAYIRGKKLSEQYFDNNNNLIREVINTYSGQAADDYVRAWRYSALPTPNSNGTSNMPGTNFVTTVASASYRIYTGKHNLIEQTIRTYDNNNFIQTSETYEYNKHNLLSQTGILRSDGKKQSTRWVYPFDIIEGSNTTVWRKMITKNMLSNCVEKVTYLPDGKVIDGEYHKFNEISANSGIFRPEQIDLLPKNATTTIQNLFSYRNGNTYLYLESGVHSNSIVTKQDTFSIRKYPTRVKLDMLFQQVKGYINYSPVPVCFILTIKKNNATI
jgi:hypothetical protein